MSSLFISTAAGPLPGKVSHVTLAPTPPTRNPIQTQQRLYSMHFFLLLLLLLPLTLLLEVHFFRSESRTKEKERGTRNLSRVRHCARRVVGGNLAGRGETQNEEPARVTTSPTPTANTLYTHTHIQYKTARDYK